MEVSWIWQQFLDLMPKSIGNKSSSGKEGQRGPQRTLKLLAPSKDALLCRFRQSYPPPLCPCPNVRVLSQFSHPSTCVSLPSGAPQSQRAKGITCGVLTWSPPKGSSQKQSSLLQLNLSLSSLPAQAGFSPWLGAWPHDHPRGPSGDFLFSCLFT